MPDDRDVKHNRAAAGAAVLGAIPGTVVATQARGAVRRHGSEAYVQESAANQARSVSSRIRSAEAQHLAEMGAESDSQIQRRYEQKVREGATRRANELRADAKAGLQNRKNRREAMARADEYERGVHNAAPGTVEHSPRVKGVKEKARAEIAEEIRQRSPANRVDSVAREHGALAAAERKLERRAKVRGRLGAAGALAGVVAAPLATKAVLDRVDKADDRGSGRELAVGALGAGAAGGGALYARNAAREAMAHRDVIRPVVAQEKGKAGLKQMATMLIPGRSRRARAQEKVAAGVEQRIQDRVGGNIDAAKAGKIRAMRGMRVAQGGTLVGVAGLSAAAARSRAKKEGDVAKLSEVSKRHKKLTEEEKRNRTQARVGLASNAVGLAAGINALKEAATNPNIRGKVGSFTPAVEPKKISGRTKALAGGALALQAANLGGDVVANRVLARSAGVEKPVKKSREGMPDVYISKAEQQPTMGRSLEVDKAYRRYDPEADRQRRLGLYAGLGALGAGVAGQQAVQGLTTDVQHQGGKVRGLAVKPGKGKKAAIAAAIAAGSGAGGVAAYRRGISERNQPWN